MGGFSTVTRCVRPHHAGSLTVADVRVEPGQPPEDASESGDPHAGQAVEAGVAGHCAQQVLLNLREEGEPA